MKKVIFMALLCLITGAVFAQNNGDKVLGIWMMTTKTAKIEIYKSNNKYYGKVLWGTLLYEQDGKTSLKDDKNPDPKLRNRDRVGLVFITDLTYKDGEYAGGKIYDSTSGKTYKLTMKLIDDKNLEMRGYLGFSLLGRSVEWMRVKD